MKTDSEIQKDVMEALKCEPLLSPNEIGVAVKEGVITLTGTVNSYSKKFVAEKATWRVEGAKAVAEELVVHLGNDNQLTDKAITGNILNTLKWNTSNPDEKIKVKVTDGWVYLEGDVDWNFQKDSVGNAILCLKGIKGVTNLITVKSRINTDVVKDHIPKALYTVPSLKHAI